MGLFLVSLYYANLFQYLLTFSACNPVSNYEFNHHAIIAQGLPVDLFIPDSVQWNRFGPESFLHDDTSGPRQVPAQALGHESGAGWSSLGDRAGAGHRGTY